MNSKPETRNSKLVLAGDIGGTKTLLALGEEKSVVAVRRYASRDHADFGGLLRSFLDETGAHGKVTRACFGVAGPVAGNRSKVTYLPWVIDGNALAQEFGIGRVAVVNDFEAAARGIETLGPGELVSLQAGLPQEGGVRVIIGAGTGLGVAALLPQDRGWRVVGGEGGHVGFAPADDEQSALGRFIRQRAGRASAERVLSGPGLVETYRFLCSEHGHADAPDPLQAEDPAAAISAGGLARPDSLCSRTLDLFARAYGSFAGDLALLFMARGGVYLAGGIAPKLLPRLRGGGFMDAFRAKAEHAGLMPGFPVHVVINERLGLQGAANIANSL